VTVSRGGGVNVEADVTPATSYSTAQLAALLPGELYHHSVSHCSVLMPCIASVTFPSEFHLSARRPIVDLLNRVPRAVLVQLVTQFHVHIAI
jgi:hypothetical protein